MIVDKNDEYLGLLFKVYINGLLKKQIKILLTEICKFFKIHRYKIKFSLISIFQKNIRRIIKEIKL